MGIVFSKISDVILSSKTNAGCGLFEFMGVGRICNIQGSKYVLPKDVNILDSQHYIARKLWNDDFKAPVKDVLNAGNARILDIG